MAITTLSGVLIAATLFVAIVTGLLFGFALLTMPGIGRMSDREFVRAFQFIDRIIQNGHPLFVVTWAGSALLLPLATVLSFRTGVEAQPVLILSATVGYYLGVQLPTIAINVPLNNALQKVDAVSLDEATIGAARRDFETRWNRWNQVRTVVGVAVTVLLLIAIAVG